MDNVTNRAILIGVSLTVSISIISILIIVIGQVREIYQVNSQNSFLFTEGFTEFDMYNNTMVKGIDVLNCIKKYEMDDRIIVEVNSGNNNYTIRCGQKLNILPQIKTIRQLIEKETDGESGYNLPYTASYDDSGKKELNKVIITFNRK